VPRIPKTTRRPPKTARYGAIETLCRIQRSRAPVKPLLEGIGAECRLTAADRSLAMNMVYGVLRRRQYLECLIRHLCRHPLHKLDPFVLHGLEVGLFQLLFLDRIPESAAVNETINALKAAGCPNGCRALSTASCGKHPAAATLPAPTPIPIPVGPGSTIRPGSPNAGANGSGRRRCGASVPATAPSPCSC